MSDEREKKSWSEIDQARNRGIKFEKKVSKSDTREQKLAKTAAKKELDSLFSGSKISKEKSKRLDEIKSLRGKPAFYEKLSDYFKEFGVPLEFDVQMLFLDHRDKTLVLQVLSELLKQAPRLDLSKQDLLNSKLKVMALSVFDPELSDKILEVQKSILRL
ncbi:MAG: hypothetical protein JWQ35_1801 [Bacteriovoracaceae bacterium]|nr:hypothetical protein [Bacteriovoracaceae bacterium]